MSRMTVVSATSIISSEGSMPDCCSARRTSVTKPSRLSWLAETLHGDRHTRADEVQRGRAGACLLEHPAPDRDDQPGLLGQRDEVRRGQDAL